MCWKASGPTLVFVGVHPLVFLNERWLVVKAPHFLDSYLMVTPYQDTLEVPSSGNKTQMLGPHWPLAAPKVRPGCHCEWIGGRPLTVHPRHQPSQVLTSLFMRPLPMATLISPNRSLSQEWPKVIIVRSHSKKKLTCQFQTVTWYVQTGNFWKHSTFLPLEKVVTPVVTYARESSGQFRGKETAPWGQAAVAQNISTLFISSSSQWYLAKRWASRLSKHNLGAYILL